VVAACTLESSLYDIERMSDESRDDTGSETSGALYERGRKNGRLALDGRVDSGHDRTVKKGNFVIMLELKCVAIAPFRCGWSVEMRCTVADDVVIRRGPPSLCG